MNGCEVLLTLIEMLGPGQIYMVQFAVVLHNLLHQQLSSPHCPTLP